MSGAPFGNKYAAKAKRWEEALRRALSRAGGTIDKGLAPIADRVVKAALKGEIEAIREIANRLDGKPTEHVELDIPADTLAYASFLTKKAGDSRRPDEGDQGETVQ